MISCWPVTSSVKGGRPIAAVPSLTSHLIIHTDNRPRDRGPDSLPGSKVGLYIKLAGGHRSHKSKQRISVSVGLWTPNTIFNHHVTGKFGIYWTGTQCWEADRLLSCFFRNSHNLPIFVIHSSQPRWRRRSVPRWRRRTWKALAASWGWRAKSRVRPMRSWWSVVSKALR